MSFQEKSAWAMLLIIAGVYGFYFVDVLPEAMNDPVSLESVAGRLFRMIILLVGLGVVAHIAIAILNPSQSDEADERDRYIEMRADARSSYVMGAGVLTALGMALLEQPIFWVAHVLLAALVLGEMAKSIFRIIDYRFGV